MQVTKTIRVLVIEALQILWNLMRWSAYTHALMAREKAQIAAIPAKEI
jgi:hypothetical protein